MIGGKVVRDVLDGTTASGSPFLPTAANDGVGPTTGERMEMLRRRSRAARGAAPPPRRWSEAGFAPESITHLVTVSVYRLRCAGAWTSHSSVVWGCPPTVQRTHVGFMGCHGAEWPARGECVRDADPAARVLAAARWSLCSLHYYYGSAADKLVANAIFADGAAALCGQCTIPVPRG